jgi:hypothetical protein
MARYINRDTEDFVKGTYQGENVFDVAEEDAAYLNNLLENFSLDADDKELIMKALGKSVED